MQTLCIIIVGTCIFLTLSFREREKSDKSVVFIPTDCPAPSWEDLEAVMKSLKIVVQGLVDFVRRFNHRRPEMAPPQNTRYKTSMCRDFTAKGSCPRGASCTFAHSQEELEQ